MRPLLYITISCTIITPCFAKKTLRPNVILIYADDLGRGMLSHYGQKQFTTPHIDSLFRCGTGFENAYGCMVSAASRASLLTGYHGDGPMRRFQRFKRWLSCLDGIQEILLIRKQIAYSHLVGTNF